MIATHTLALSDEAGHPEPVSLLAGKAAALFAVLAGFSIALSTRTYQDKTPAVAALLTRGALIALIGLLLGSFSTNLAVILLNYGVMFMLATFVFRTPTKLLAWLAPAWLVVTPILGFWIRATASMERATEVPNLGNYMDLPYLFSAVFLTGYYPVLQWFGYLLVGLLLARLDWTRVATMWRVAVVGTASAALASAVSWLLLSAGGYVAITRASEGIPEAAWGSVTAALRTGSYGTVPTDTWWWVTVAGPHTSTPFDLVYTAGLAAGVIALCMLACHYLRASKALLLPLLAAGSMPLSLYTAHVILREATPEVVIHIGLLLIVATVWVTQVQKPGPLEWLVSTATKKVAPRQPASASATP